MTLAQVAVERLTESVLADVEDEMYAQIRTWGVQSHPDGTGSNEQIAASNLMKDRCKTAAADGSVTWEHILTEEYAEALAETNPTLLVTELIQTAAVALSWARDIQSRSI